MKVLEVNAWLCMFDLVEQIKLKLIFLLEKTSHAHGFLVVRTIKLTYNMIIGSRMEQEDEINFYGGSTTNLGKAGIQIFSADIKTQAMIPAEASNI
jgi:hypothetical protein